MAIQETVKNLPGGGVIKAYHDDSVETSETTVVNTVDLMIDLADTLTELEKGSSDRHKAICKIINFIIEKKDQVELTPKLQALLDELESDDAITTFDRAMKDKVMKVERVR